VLRKLQFGFTEIILSKQVVHQRVIARCCHDSGRVGRTRRLANAELTADDQYRSVYKFAAQHVRLSARKN
jgi:hypothetical protein